MNTAADSASGWLPLAGGTMAQVARRGQVVRRSTGYWTPAVHALLRHLESVGFKHAPRVLGVDSAGHEFLSYTPGHTPDPRRWTGNKAAVIEAGHILREYHDAVAAFRPPADARWDMFFCERQDPAAAGDELVICHNDFGVHNCVFRDGLPWAMIDFDGASPGSRVWDLAATACGFVSLRPGIPAAARSTQLSYLCHGYGWTDGPALVQAIIRLLTHRYHGLHAAIGTAAPQAAIATDHLAYVERSLLLMRAQRSALEEALVAGLPAAGRSRLPPARLPPP